MVVVDFPHASAFLELILDTQIVNTASQVTTLSLLQGILTNTVIDLEFDTRLPESDGVTLLNGVYRAADLLIDAIQPLANLSTFELIAIGAEIDELSETLWIWLDDPEDPL